MTMQLSQLRTYWTADDAHWVISFLDELRDVLWATDSAEIIEQQQANPQADDRDEQKMVLDIGEASEF